MKDSEITAMLVARLQACESAITDLRVSFASRFDNLVKRLESRMDSCETKTCYNLKQNETFMAELAKLGKMVRP